MRPAWAIALLAAAMAETTHGQAAESCAAPPVWSAADAKPGRPNQELSACLRSEAYKARDLHIPMVSMTNGIVAICEVEIDRIEHAMVFDNATMSDDQRRAIEQDVMRRATAAATQYRSCAAG